MAKAGIFKLGESGLDVSPLEQQREFSYQIKIYDRTLINKVAEIASGIKNVTLESLKFGYLQDGGCAGFSFTLGEEFTQATIGYNYRVELCFYNQPNPWYQGFITKLPEKGTDKKQTYSGYGYVKQLSWIRIDRKDLAQEVADIVETTLNYVVARTDIVKDDLKLTRNIYPMVSNIYWDKIPASDLFERLRQLAGSPDYEWGVDEERDFYFRAINTNVLENFWIGKHLNSFKGTEDPDSIRNRLYVKCGRLTDGSDYTLQVPDPSVEPTASQITYGLREEVVVAPEIWPTFSATDLANGKTVLTDPVGTNPGFAVDANPANYWDSDNVQNIGNSIRVDLGVGGFPHIARVVLDSTDNAAKEQFARGFSIRISMTTGGLVLPAALVFTSTALSTNNPDIRFTPIKGRYVLITLTANDTEHWHLGEVKVYQLDTSDIGRWANYVLDQKKIIRKKATLTIKGINKLIEKKHVIKPLKPYGKWGIYAEEGSHIEDYQVKSIKYILSGNSFDMSAELGQLERESVPAEFKRTLQRLEEYNMSGIRSSDDLASGIGSSPLGITRTMIGPDVIEVPMLKSNKISMYGGKVEAGEGVMSLGGHGFKVSDGTYVRFEAGKLNGDYGVTIRDATGNIMVNLGSFTYGDAKARAYASVMQELQINGPATKIRLDSETYDPGNNFDNSLWASGNTTGAAANKLIDAGAAFVAAMVGSLVKNTTDNTFSKVQTFDSPNQLGFLDDIFAFGEGYSIIQSKFVAPIDGDYICVGSIGFSINVATLRDEAFVAALYKNDVSFSAQLAHSGSLPGNTGVTPQVMDIIPLAVGDEVTLWGGHSADDVHVDIATGTYTFLCCHLLSAI